jgi:hypothetical protein
MPIDKMNWHYGGDFPENLPTENGGTHIGMYLAWVINNELIGEMHVKESSASIESVKTRRMTGRDFLINECAGKFSKDDLNDEGLKFTRYYYGDDDMKDYIIDYLNVLAPDLESVYHVEDTWENYDKISNVMDSRFREWKALKSS